MSSSMLKMLAANAYRNAHGRKRHVPSLLPLIIAIGSAALLWVEPAHAQPKQEGTKVTSRVAQRRKEREEAAKEAAKKSGKRPATAAPQQGPPSIPRSTVEAAAAARNRVTKPEGGTPVTTPGPAAGTPPANGPL